MENEEASDLPSTVERQRSPRPESTMALNFSQALDGVFNLGGDNLGGDSVGGDDLGADLGGLNQTVEEKKQAVTIRNQELEAIEQRLRAAEEKLQKVGAAQPAASTGQQEPKQSSPTSRKPLPSAPTTGGAPNKELPIRRNPAVAASIADRAPTPMDPARSDKSMPPGAYPETPSDAVDANDYYSRSRS